MYPKNPAYIPSVLDFGIYILPQPHRAPCAPDQGQKAGDFPFSFAAYNIGLDREKNVTGLGWAVTVT